MFTLQRLYNVVRGVLCSLGYFSRLHLFIEVPSPWCFHEYMEGIRCRQVLRHPRQGPWLAGSPVQVGGTGGVRLVQLNSDFRAL
jgi:hypothetical protein